VYIYGQQVYKCVYVYMHIYIHIYVRVHVWFTTEKEKTHLFSDKYFTFTFFLKGQKLHVQKICDVMAHFTWTSPIRYGCLGSRFPRPPNTVSRKTSIYQRLYMLRVRGPHCSQNKALETLLVDILAAEATVVICIP
jgi:hypothetical protein